MKFNLPLNDRETARLYWELSERGAFCSGEMFPWRYAHLSEEELLTLALNQSRYDPRLVAVLVDYFKTARSIDPVHWKNSLRQAGALPIAAVIGEFILDSPADPAARELFRFLMIGARPVPTQLFYRGLYPLAGKKMQEVIDRPLWLFKKWGFLAGDLPLLKDHATGGRYYLFDSSVRLRILKKVAEEKGRFRLKDYLGAVGFSISRQQALKDVRSTHTLRKQGRGKGTVYVYTSSP